LLIQLFNRQMPLNINLFPSHKLNYNDHSIKTFAQHYKKEIQNTKRNNQLSTKTNEKLDRKTHKKYRHPITLQIHKID
ncbi:MAG: hypothetical protein PQ964_06725, partial [Methanobacteriaceae archaeon]